MADSRLCGWVRDDDSRDAFAQELGRDGEVYNAQPALRGEWARQKSKGRTFIFLPAHEHKFHRKELASDHQQEGTCVARGTYKVCQLSISCRAVVASNVARPVLIAYEPIYWGSRNIVGGGRLGNGAGSVGAWAAKWVQEYGICERKRYSGKWDLSRDQEDLCCDNRARPPEDLFDEQKNHLVRVLKVTPETMMDCVAGLNGVARCHNTIYGERDRNGQSQAEDRGGHCQAIVGVYVDHKDRDCIIERQSWGPNMPGGPRTLMTADGPIEIPSDCYGITLEQYVDAIRDGEAWGFHVDEKNTYKPGR